MFLPLLALILAGKPNPQARTDKEKKACVEAVKALGEVFESKTNVTIENNNITLSKDAMIIIRIGVERKRNIDENYVDTEDRQKTYQEINNITNSRAKQDNIKIETKQKAIEFYAMAEKLDGYCKNVLIQSLLLNVITDIDNTIEFSENAIKSTSVIMNAINGKPQE